MLFKTLPIFFFIFLLSTSSFSQNLIKGIVKDSKTKEVLSFAAVQYGDGKGVITNEDGAFSIPWNPRITSLKIRYVGYQTMEYPISKPQVDIEILMQSSSTEIAEIVVKAKDLYASKVLFQSVKKSRKDARKKRTAKVFRRSYSYRANAPSEFMEAFYNVEVRDGGIDFFHLKNGRYGLPQEDYFINAELTNLLEMHKLFSREYLNLPGSPLDYTSLKKIRKDFDVRIRKKFVIEQDTVLEIHFEPLRKKDILFKGKVWVKKSNLRIEKVWLEIKDSARNPFVTIIAPKLNKVGKLDLKFNIGFKYLEDELVFDYFQIEERKLIVNPYTEFEVVTNTKLVFYDYAQPFQLPFFSKYSSSYHDYEKILFFPYDREFWKRNFLISETVEEAKFRRELEEKELFKTQGSSQVEVIRHRFEPWSEDWKVNPDLIGKEEARKGLKPDEVIHEIRKYPNPQNNLFASTFISLDYECYADTLIFKTEAVMDYRFSYSVYRNDLAFRYLENFLHLAKIQANELQLRLVRKFKNKRDCPNRIELKMLLEDANGLLAKEVEKYRYQCHLHREEYRLDELTREIRRGLERSFLDLGVWR